MPDKPFRWRTVVEIALISAVLYILLGTPGLRSSAGKPSSSSLGGDDDGHVVQTRAESLVYPDGTNLNCARHDYQMHIFSTAPLVVYIDGFLSEGEAEHLVDISANKWQPSTIFSAGGQESTDEALRKSDKALIDRDTVVQCIEQRALAVQGWPEHTFIERLWTQRYNVSGHYGFHYDWSTATKVARRVSSFMVYLHAECEGGGTNFPRLTMPTDQRWCEFVECDGDGKTEGVTFKARKGSAVFWMNFDSEGRGYREVIHAGLPVTKGTKIGLNIWSWYQKGHTVPSS